MITRTTKRRTLRELLSLISWTDLISLAGLRHDDPIDTTKKYWRSEELLAMGDSIILDRIVDDSYIVSGTSVLEIQLSKDVVEDIDASDATELTKAEQRKYDALVNYFGRCKGYTWTNLETESAISLLDELIDEMLGKGAVL